MNCYINRKEVKADGDPKISIGYNMLSEKQGCVKGCCSGIVYVYTGDYPAPGVHDDQEGFLVLEGTGWAKVGDEEFRLEPDVCFIAAKGVAHCVKKDPGVEYIKYFYFHSAV